MKLTSPYTPSQIKEILNEQVDNPPSILRCLLTLNAHYYVGTSPVCGKVGENEFDLRSRKGPYFSIRAKGKLIKSSSGTDIELTFSKPILPDILGLLFNRYKIDKKVILDFLQEWLKVNDDVEQPL